MFLQWNMMLFLIDWSGNAASRLNSSTAMNCFHQPAVGKVSYQGHRHSVVSYLIAESFEAHQINHIIDNLMHLASITADTALNKPAKVS